jgi:hypothetical protein
MLRHLDPDMD